MSGTGERPGQKAVGLESGQETFEAHLERWKEIRASSGQDVQIETAANCLKMGLSIDFIVRITGLDREVVKKLGGELLP